MRVRSLLNMTGIVIGINIVYVCMIWWITLPNRTAQAAPPPPTGWTTEVRVLRVIDGDTVEVEIRRRLRVRMQDCWAPETRTRDVAEKRRGIASKRYLVELVEGEMAILYVSGNEDLSKLFTFGRILGDLWLVDDDETLAEKMIEAGHATREKSR